ncbi:flavoprotein [Dendrosporobacter sp. 1207_IL3150]|uniref:flavoprotein n=1 Tax=Dendrosporobacter sp. 1207_IL3150 TaxID=3084054 RepID=UPI002FD8E77E
MDNESLIQYITSEVLRKLKSTDLEEKQETSVRRNKALVILTGGTIGLDQAMCELQEIQNQNIDITVVLSKAAEEIIGINRVHKTLGGDINVVTAHSPYPGKELREADLVLVPVLTQNTVAKIAYTILDTMPATLILQALQLGKPVVAAENAADPHDDWRVKAKMGNASPTLAQALRANLNKARAFGINLVKVNELAALTSKLLYTEVKNEMAPIQAGRKAVLDAGTVKSAALNGSKSLIIADGTIVTPLAADVAREYGIELVTASNSR